MPGSSSEMPNVKNGPTKAQAIPATDSAIPTNDLWLLRTWLIPTTLLFTNAPQAVIIVTIQA
jgi:hypothetical protein